MSRPVKHEIRNSLADIMTECKFSPHLGVHILIASNYRLTLVRQF